MVVEVGCRLGMNLWLLNQKFSETIRGLRTIRNAVKHYPFQTVAAFCVVCYSDRSKAGIRPVVCVAYEPLTKHSRDLGRGKKV